MVPELGPGWPEPPACVSLLQAAPWLGSELSSEEWHEASACLQSLVLTAPAGDALLTASVDLVGLLVGEGLLAAQLRVSGYTSTLLLGSGDMVCACDIDSPQGSMPEQRSLLALTAVQLVAVDQSLLRSCLRWPPVGKALLESLTQRLRLNTLSLAVHQSPRVEERLWLALWQLADRFGRVSPSGAVVTLPGVTHSVLAEVVAARRPSVSSAMRRLSDGGLIEVTGRHRWLLRQQPEEGLRSLAVHPRPARSLAA